MRRALARAFSNAGSLYVIYVRTYVKSRDDDQDRKKEDERRRGEIVAGLGIFGGKKRSVFGDQDGGKIGERERERMKRSDGGAHKLAQVIFHRDADSLSLPLSLSFDRASALNMQQLVDLLHDQALSFMTFGGSDENNQVS